MIWYSISISVVAIVGPYLLWRFWTSRSHKERAVQILYWIESALAGNGHVSGIRWLSADEFEVPLRLVSTVFNRANVRVKIAKARLPFFGALISRFKRSEEASHQLSETFTFRADFDYQPAFNLEINNLRWFARSKQDNNLHSPSWHFESAEPVVLTTRLDWEKEPTSAFQSMLGVQQREDMHVEFRKKSPHFCATMPLEKITPQSEVSVFEVLHSIATASAAKAS